jgi:hypothetical protein
MNKVFIIGLPRTGTTSISAALLDYDFKVAHTAFTKRAFELADVVSDAPCFSDYRQLDQLFPDSRFIYLDRALISWLPSIERLLHKMQVNLAPQTGHFNPVLKRSFNTTFDLFSSESPFSHTHLQACYQRHQQEVFDYFLTPEGNSKNANFLRIDISQPESLSEVLVFLDLEPSVTTENKTGKTFPHLNIGKRVDNWKEIKHPNKVNPNSAGREHRKFFDYSLLKE